eukprot:scaffold256_cov121-Isochrysis_galbana.AAC.3
MVWCEGSYSCCHHAGRSVARQSPASPSPSTAMLLLLKAPAIRPTPPCMPLAARHPKVASGSSPERAALAVEGASSRGPELPVRAGRLGCATPRLRPAE